MAVILRGQAMTVKESKQARTVDVFGRLAQTLAVVIGVIISVMSYTTSRRAEAIASQHEASRSFLELRQKYYLDTVRTVATLANGDTGSEEYKTAAKRFRDLYLGEMCLVEAADVEDCMVDFAKSKADLSDLDDMAKDDPRFIALNLSHALRDSLAKSWNLPETILDNSFVPAKAETK